MHLILHKLEKLCSTEELTALRLVCKAWLAAFNDYPGNFTCTQELDTDVDAMLRIMPSMSSLTLRAILSYTGPLNLSACFQLTRLDASPGFQPRRPGKGFQMSACLQPARLPHSLRELILRDLEVDLNCIQALSCTRLTKLALVCGEAAYKDFKAVLEHLPELKVSVSCHIQNHANLPESVPHEQDVDNFPRL